MKARFLLPLSLPCLLLTGCTSNNASTNPIRGIAASFVAGRAFDRRINALQRDNLADLKSANHDFKRATNAGWNSKANVIFARGLTEKAELFSTLVTLSEDEKRGRYLTQSDESYRFALEFAPTKSPEKFLDAQTLNALGYFLADRGESRADFERAAQLTKAAYDNWPILKGPSATDSIIIRATAPQDSYAWALFKLGRYEEARVQQEEVMNTVRAINPALMTTPDLPFHMAEIYRALGEKDKARVEYAVALALNPNDDLKGKIMMGIQSLDFKQV